MEGIPLLGIDHLEFYVADAQLAAYFYRTAFGLEPLLYAGPETGLSDRISLLVGRASIHLLLTSAVHADSPVARAVAEHGDGVKVIAFRVADSEAAFRSCVDRGAKPIAEPTVVESNGSRVVTSKVLAFGDVEHAFVERRHGDELMHPLSIQLVRKVPIDEPCDLMTIDHLAVCLDRGQLESQVSYYQALFDFRVVHQEDVRTGVSSMNSKVVANDLGSIKFALQEPAEGPKRSQIEEFLETYRGPGVQHSAFLTSNIVATARRLRRYGVSFLNVPNDYYDEVPARVGEAGVPIDVLRDLRILVAADATGLLYQSFTKPIHARPTYFTEVIERRGSTGFGSANVKALFGAIEREQGRRGGGL